MTEGLKWTVNHVAKSDDKYLELMSEENVKKANEFHKSFPQYTVTPLQDLAALASCLGYDAFEITLKTIFYTSFCFYGRFTY